MQQHGIVVNVRYLSLAIPMFWCSDLSVPEFVPEIGSDTCMMYFALLQICRKLNKGAMLDVNSEFTESLWGYLSRHSNVKFDLTVFSSAKQVNQTLTFVLVLYDPYKKNVYDRMQRLKRPFYLPWNDC